MTIMLQIYRYDKEKQNLKEIYSNWDTEYDKELFSGYLKDDYKVVMEYKEIGFSETVSLLDAEYKAKELEVGEGNIDNDDFWMVRLWKDKKLQNDKVDEDTVFLYTLDDVTIVKSDGGIPQLKFERDVDVAHRSETVGDMYTYLQYNEEKDTFVLTKAEFKL